MKLTDIGTVRSLMERHGLRFDKSKGQNFLINEAVPARIARECGASPESGILEIGPGIGTLTRELAQRYCKVVAVELDRGLIPVLGETLAEYSNTEIISADILKTDLDALVGDHFGGMPVSVCANLPYYITTPILMRLLESRISFDYITVMVQREVAQRLTSKPGTASYGAVTAAVSYYGTVSQLFGVSAGSFIPAPKIDSAVIRIKVFKSPPVEVRDEKLMFNVISAAFSQRRKTLVNALSGVFRTLSKPELSEIIQSCGLRADIRGETLGIDRFAELSSKLSARTQAADTDRSCCSERK